MERRMRRAALAIVAVCTATVGLTYAGPVEAGPVPQPLTVSVSGVNGVDRIQDPGRRCADGGSGEYRHASIDAPLPITPNAVISASLPAVLRGSFDVHHDGSEIVGAPISPAANQAFLQGSESHVTLSNQRGSVQLRLTSGTCASPTLAYDGTTVSGTGAWTVDPLSTTGSYRNTTGSGTFALSLGVAPGADNPWNLNINGGITVLQPQLLIEVIGSSWGNLGVDYVTRRPTVTYRITNTGPGDTFNPVLTGATSPTHGVSTLGVVPQALPDLQSGQSTIVSVRYQLALLGGPCALVILGCQFDTTLSVSMPDVLDKADSPPPSATVHVRTPDLPPPLA
jgi:hypothetical protein